MAFNRPKLFNKAGNEVRKVYIHQPVSIEFKNTKASIKTDGKVIIEQGEGDEFDLVETSASFIFKIGLLLDTKRTQDIVINNFGIKATIKASGEVVMTSEPQKVEGSDEVEYDEVKVSSELIFKLSSLLRATREVQFVEVEAEEKK